MEVYKMNPNPINWSQQRKTEFLFKGALKISSRPAYWMGCMNRQGQTSRPLKKQTISFSKEGRKTSKVVYHLA